MKDNRTEFDKLLFAKISEGDETAFTEIYRIYVPRLINFLTGITQSTQVTNELIQETFLQIWLHRDKLPDVEYPQAWIFRIASNIAYNYLKRKVVEKKVMEKVNYAQPTIQNAIEESLCTCTNESNI